MSRDATLEQLEHAIRADLRVVERTLDRLERKLAAAGAPTAGVDAIRDAFGALGRPGASRRV